MATSNGFSTIEPLSKGQDPLRWLQRFDAYAGWHEFTNDKKKLALLALMGSEMYGLLADAVLPDIPANKTFDELTLLLKAQLQPRRLAIAERYEFNKTRQSSSESVSDFVRKLRYAAINCEFGTQLEDRLRDQLVFGIGSRDALKKMLILKLSDLTLKKAIDIALADEAVAGQSWSTPCTLDEDTADVRKITDGRLTCFCCGKPGHSKPRCRFKNEVCHNCNVKGHLKIVCRGKKVRAVKVEDETNHQSDGSEFELTFMMGKGRFHKSVTLNGKPITMCFDTASDVSIINENTFKTLPEVRLDSYGGAVRDYNLRKIDILGCAMVSVKQEDVVKVLPVLVTSGNFANIYGCDWIHAFTPDFNVNSIANTREISLELKKNAKPVFMKPRVLPYGLRDAVKAEIDRLVNENILTPVSDSEWATPIVPVRKENGHIRICGDYKVTLNPQLLDMVSTTPTMEDVINATCGSTVFSKIDLKNAYNQLPLDFESSKLTTISTPFGLFRYNTLPFGIKQSPALFQKFIDQLLSGIDGIEVYQDDICVHGSDDTHDKRVSAVKDRLKSSNVQINDEKTMYSQSEISILGTIVGRNGHRPDPRKVKVINGFAVPTNVSELRSFLGMIEFYGKYIDNLASIKEPLTKLLRKGEPFMWEDEQAVAFRRLKGALGAEPLLTTFDPMMEVTVTTDASPVGVGAVLEQGGKPVLFISKTLTMTERKYAQIEREALAIVWAVKRLHKYLYGRQFKLVTDNKPLYYMFQPSKSLSVMTASRLQRWVIFLMAYTYDIVHRKANDIPVADALSRYSSANSETKVFDVQNIQETIVPPPVSKTRIRDEVKKDALVSKLYEFTIMGWNGAARKTYSYYYALRDEFSVQDGLLYRGNRVIIPKGLHNEVLEKLHEGHMGNNSMKSIARQCVWWKTIDIDIQQHVALCDSCCRGKSASKSTWTSWPEETTSWSRVHIDYCGPFENGLYALVIVDAFSRWPEVHLTRSMTATETIGRLRRTFAQEGVPVVLVSDNAPEFCASEFQTWLRCIGCHHVLTPPYHPRSNGLAERFVRTLKDHVRAANRESPLQAVVDRFLQQYRNTKHSSTKVAPSILMRGHLLRSPVLALSRVQSSDVWVRKYLDKQQLWEPAKVIGCEGRNLLDVQLQNGKFRRVHTEQAKPRLVKEELPKADVAGAATNGESDLPLSSVESDKAVAVEEEVAELPIALHKPIRNVGKPNRLTF